MGGEHTEGTWPIPVTTESDLFGNFGVTVVVMSRVKVVQRACLAIVATLLVAACGSGTESVHVTESDGRNVALADDNGLPFPGLMGRIENVAIEPTSQGAWVGGQSVTTGLVTGGLALYQDPKFLTLDPAFPRIDGSVSVINFNAPNSEIVIGGWLDAVGARNGMQPRQGLAIVNPNGLRDVDISFNLPVTSLARIGNMIYARSNSTQVIDQATGFTQNARGLYRIDARTGRLVDQPQLEGIGARFTIEDFAPGRLVTIDTVKMAVVAEDQNDGTFSLLIYNVVTGTMQKLLLTGQLYVGIQSIENGYALVKTSSAVRGAGAVYRVLDIEAGAFLGTYSPAGQETLGAYAGEGRVRVSTSRNGSQFLVDLDPRTLVPLKTTQLPSAELPYGTTSYIIWAGADHTLFPNSALYSTSTNQVQYLRQRSPYDRISTAKFISGRGLLIGGQFDTAIETVHNELVRIPDEGRIYGVRDAGDSIYTLDRMVSTPRGPVAMANGDSIWLLGRDASVQPTRIATYTRPNICFGQKDLYTVGNSVFVTGCWKNLTVNDTTTMDNIVEIDLSGETPRIARTYTTALDQPAQIAVTENYLFVATINDELVTYSRATGEEIGRREHAGIVWDMLAVTRNGTEVLLVGGQVLKMANSGFVQAPLLQLTVTDQSVRNLLLSPTDLVGNTVASLAVDAGNTDPAGPRYVYAAGQGLRVAGREQAVVQLDFDTGAVDPRMTLAPVGFVLDIAVHGNRLWGVGSFETVKVNDRTYRTSSVVAYNLDTHTIFERGTIPLVTTTTTPPTTVASAVAPVDTAPDTSTTNPEDALTGPPVGPTPPPLLPDSGDAAPGTYTVESDGVRTEVQVLPDGSIKILPNGQGAVATGLMIIKLVPGSRTVKVSWSSVSGKPVYKVTTGRGKAKRTCTTSKNSCTVKNLDPWKAHAFIVEAVKGKKKYASPSSPRIKPFVAVKKGSSTKVSSIAPQGAKGKAKWTTGAPCSVKNGKLVAPKKSGKCQLTVTVGKSTRKVMVRVS